MALGEWWVLQLHRARPKGSMFSLLSNSETLTAFKHVCVSEFSLWSYELNGDQCKMLVCRESEVARMGLPVGS